MHRKSSNGTAEAQALHGEPALVRCDLLQVRLSLQEGHAALAQPVLGARAPSVLRAVALCAVGGQQRQRGTSRGRHNSMTQAQLYSIPPMLCSEIASAVNARLALAPALSLLGLLQRLDPRLQSLDDAPHHGRELCVVERQQLLPAPLRLPGDAAALQVLPEALLGRRP